MSTLEVDWKGAAGAFWGCLPSLDLCASTATLLSEFFAADDRVFLFAFSTFSPPLFPSCGWRSGALDEKEKLSRFRAPRRPTEWNEDTSRGMALDLSSRRELYGRA